MQDLDLEGFSDQAFVLSPAPSAPGGAAGACSWLQQAQSCIYSCLAPPPLSHQPGPPPACAPAGAYSGSSAAPLLLSTLPDAPKIRVIVRKRPLNRKVSTAAWRSPATAAAGSQMQIQIVQAGSPHCTTCISRCC